MVKKTVHKIIGGRRLQLSNLDKVFYPEVGFTKAQVIDYYLQIAPALLPHLEDRPISLKRYPDGVTGSYFYENQCPPNRPDGFRTAPVMRKPGSIVYCSFINLPALAWPAILPDFTLHPFLPRPP